MNQVLSLVGPVALAAGTTLFYVYLIGSVFKKKFQPKWLQYLTEPHPGGGPNDRGIVFASTLMAFGTVFTFL